MAPRAGRAHGLRGRAGRRDGQRHVRPDRHDQQGVRRDLPGLLLEDQRGDLGPRGRQGRRPAATPPCPPRCSTACAPTATSRRRRAPSSTSAGCRTRRSSSRKDGKRLGSSQNGQFGFGFDPQAKRFNPLSLTAGRWAAGPGQVVIDKGTAQDERPRRRASRSAWRRAARCGSTRITGIARYGTVELDRRLDDRRLRRPHRAGAAGQARAVRHDLRRRPRRRRPPSSSSASCGRSSRPPPRSRPASSRRTPTPRTPRTRASSSSTSCSGSASSRSAWARS